MKKYGIEKDTVQETLLIPLYGRKLSSERFPALFTDDSAARLMAKIDYDLSALEKRSDSIVQVFGALEVAMRQSDIACFPPEDGSRIWRWTCATPNGRTPSTPARRTARCCLPPECFTISQPTRYAG